MVFCELCQGNHKKVACVEITPRKHYVIRDEDSAYKVAVFNRAEVEAAYGVVTVDNSDEMIARLVGWYAHSSGAGQSFAHEPHMHIFKRNIMIRQFSGLDI